MKKVAVIGGGISGLSIAQMLKDRYYVTVYEKENYPGGLVSCTTVDGALYHKVGGHVFNSKYQEVLDWFWSFFDMENEFTKTDRNAIISLEKGKLINYPIENYAYMLDEKTMKSFIRDLLLLATSSPASNDNFEDFLLNRFGSTLYELYFKPYNEKIWRKDLKKVPLEWLEGKLPMPTVEEMIYNNFNHVQEKNMVHSSFYYPRNNGSQFLANRFAENLNIHYNSEILSLVKTEQGWEVEGELFDQIIFCGNIKQLPVLIKGNFDISSYILPLEELEFHGTTSVFCEISPNSFSWIYLPENSHLSHRIICTGNFSSSNNGNYTCTGTVEFTDYISEEEIKENLKQIPFNPVYIAHKYTEYTYPIQNVKTKKLIDELKKKTEKEGLFLLGRFAEWEYYNMDAAMKAALELAARIN